VADHESLDKSFFDLAEHAAASPQSAGRSRTAAARAHQAHLEHGVFDNGADVESIALPHPRIGDTPASRLVLLDTGEALIGFQRVATGSDEIDHIIEIGSRKTRIGRGGQHFAIKLIGDEWLTARSPKD